MVVNNPSSLEFRNARGRNRSVSQAKGKLEGFIVFFCLLNVSIPLVCGIDRRRKLGPLSYGSASEKKEKSLRSIYVTIIVYKMARGEPNKDSVVGVEW